MTHRPYLEITLSTRPLGLEEQQNVTCQYIITGRRRRPRASRGKGGKGGEGDADSEAGAEDLQAAIDQEEAQLNLKPTEEGRTAKRVDESAQNKRPGEALPKKAAKRPKVSKILGSKATVLKKTKT